MKQKTNYNSQEAEELRQRSEYLKCVGDFARYMEKEYVTPSNGEMSLIIIAGDATVGGNQVGRIQSMMGQRYQIVTGLASMMSDKDNQPKFRMARQMAYDYGDIENRRRELRHNRRMLRISTILAAIWLLTLIAFLIADIVKGHSPLITITSILMMGFIAMSISVKWRILHLQSRTLHDDEEEKTVSQMYHAVKSVFGNTRSGQEEQPE